MIAALVPREQIALTPHSLVSRDTGAAHAPLPLVHPLDARLSLSGDHV